MERAIEKQLLAWKLSKKRKPLILQGARQVGKTYAVTKFGNQHFQSVIKLDFLGDNYLVQLFNSQKSLSPKTIIAQLEFYLRRKIDVEKDLVFFDEIQECPTAIKSLKYFAEQMPELAIICAGSYLGIMTTEDSFPVGKVEYLSMTPCSFEEFLAAADKELHEVYLKISAQDHDQVPFIFHEALTLVWRKYLALGGMPEVLNSYLSEDKKSELKAFTEARKIQLQLLEGYRSDFAKHAGKNNANHILHVFDAIPKQLSKSYDESVARFQFSNVIPKQTGFERMRGPLTWLIKARLVVRTYIANKAEHPLKGHCEENRFKLYFFDVGLLQASLGVPMEAIISESVGSYKGYIAENFVAQELFHHQSEDLISWREGEAEVEFLISQGKDLIPVEVKSSAKFSRTKSLNSFIDRYSPVMAYKLSLQNRGFEPVRKMLTMPIYLIGKLKLT